MIKLTPQELAKMVASSGRRNRQAAARSGSRPVVFLATSFQGTPQILDQTNLITAVFQEKFDVLDGRKLTGGPQLSSILSRIRKADAVIVEATYLVPNVLLELGMAFAVSNSSKKRVFLFHNRAADDSTISSLPDYIRHFDVMGYSFDIDSLRDARDRIEEKLQIFIEPEEIMRINARGSNLRPKTDPAAAYLYHPAQREIWKPSVPRIRTALLERGVKLVTSLSSPSGSNELESAIYGVSLSSSTLPNSCFIDTTSSDGVDLVGSFSLGAAFALKRGVVRLVEAKRDRPEKLSLWTGKVLHWTSTDHLLSHVLDASKSKDIGGPT